MEFSLASAALLPGKVLAAYGSGMKWVFVNHESRVVVRPLLSSDDANRAGWQPIAVE